MLGRQCSKVVLSLVQQGCPSSCAALSQAYIRFAATSLDASSSSLPQSHRHKRPAVEREMQLPFAFCQWEGMIRGYTSVPDYSQEVRGGSMHASGELIRLARQVLLTCRTS